MSSKANLVSTDQKKRREMKPKLRFSDFQNTPDWEACPLNSKVIKVGSGITPRGGYENYKDKGRPFIRSQNIGWGELLLDDVVFIDDAVHSTFISTEIQEGDVLLNITGASIGRSAVADERICGGNVNQHVCIIRLKVKELAANFLSQYLLSHYGQSQIDSFQAGGNRQGLNFAQVRSFSIPIPPKIEEQIELADCLSSIDDRITAETQKLDTLKAHKKGLMQQLFPAEGETLPKLRFPEFQDVEEWHKRKLGKLSNILRGGSPRPISAFLTQEKAGLNWLKIGDVDKGSKYITQTEERVIEAALTKTREVRPGDLIMSNSMSFGRPYILKIKSCIHDGWIAVTEISDKIDRDYLYYFILSSSSQTYFTNAAAGGGIKNLNAEIIKLLPVTFSAKKIEQQKITDCLSSLDELITAQTQKIATLKTHKKGLMQQLFPSLDEVKR